jgi:hypothetical protein
MPLERVHALVIQVAVGVVILALALCCALPRVVVALAVLEIRRVCGGSSSSSPPG